MTVTTYYADCSDGGPTDLQAVWSNDANAFDGNTGTTATTSSSSFGEGNNVLRGDGTNASTGTDTITQVRVRIHNGTSFSGYATVTAPGGSWDLSKVQGLEFLIYTYPPKYGGDFLGVFVYADGDWSGTILASTGIATFGSISKIEIEVTHTAAASGTNQWINVDDAWRQLSEAWVNVDDAWRKVTEAWVNVDDTWRKLYSV